MVVQEAETNCKMAREQPIIIGWLSPLSHKLGYLLALINPHLTYQRSGIPVLKPATGEWDMKSRQNPRTTCKQGDAGQAKVIMNNTTE